MDTQLFNIVASTSNNNNSIGVGFYVGDYNFAKTAVAAAYPVSSFATFGEGGGSIDPAAGNTVSVVSTDVSVAAIYSEGGTTYKDLVDYIIRWTCVSQGWTGPCVLLVSWLDQTIFDNATAPRSRLLPNNILNSRKVLKPEYNFDKSKLRVIADNTGKIVAYRMPAVTVSAAASSDILPIGSNVAHDIELPKALEETFTRSPERVFEHYSIVMENDRPIIKSPTLPLPPPR